MADKYTISIVDDDLSVREALTALLKAFGYMAEAFASADAFLASDRVHDTQCLILDIHMPSFDGLQLQRRLAASEHRVPIIFITAYPDDRTRARALKAGAISFLVKPFSQDALMASLDAALAANQG